MEHIQENKMGYKPVPGLILKMSLPMMVSMLVLAMYNVVDSIYVARISEAAFSAVSLVFPYQMLITAVAVGTSVGVNSLVARRLGEKRQADANSAATHGIFLAILGGLFFALLFGVLTPTLISFYNPGEEIFNHASTYIYIVGIPCIFSHVQVMSEKILQATGNTIQSMLIQLTGAVFNIVFDPILIFGQYGFPALGVAGAAIATVGGQLVGMLLGIIILARKNCLVKISFKGFRPVKDVIAGIYQVGIPSIFLQMVGSIMNFFLNKILIGFSSTAVSVLGAYFKLQSFVFMPVFGLNSGAMPIMAYNYGARNRKRIMEALKYGYIFAVFIMAVGILVFQLFPEALLGMFDASDELLTMGIPAFRALSLCFPSAGFCIMSSTLFQAVGNGKLSFWLSALRQLVLLLPLAYILASFVGLHAVWYAFPLAEIGALFFALVSVVKVYRSQIKPLDIQ